MSTGMTARYDLLIQGIAKSDQTILMIFALTMTGISTWYSFAWWPINFQPWLKRGFLVFVTGIYFSTFLYL